MAKNGQALSPREREVLSGIVNDKTYPLIARELGIGLESVRKYAKRLRDKAGVRTKTGLALWAVQQPGGLDALGTAANRKRMGTVQKQARKGA